jgi:hypothetical protein
LAIIDCWWSGSAWVCFAQLLLFFLLVFLSVELATNWPIPLSPRRQHGWKRGVLHLGPTHSFPSTYPSPTLHLCSFGQCPFRLSTSKTSGSVIPATQFTLQALKFGLTSSRGKKTLQDRKFCDLFCFLGNVHRIFKFLFSSKCSYLIFP